MFCVFVFFFKQKTAYEMRISDWSSDVCSSDLFRDSREPAGAGAILRARRGGREGGKKEHFARFRREGFCLFSDRAGRGHLTGPAWPAGHPGEWPPACAYVECFVLWFDRTAGRTSGARIARVRKRQRMRFGLSGGHGSPAEAG